MPFDEVFMADIPEWSTPTFQCYSYTAMGLRRQTSKKRGPCLYVLLHRDMSGQAKSTGVVPQTAPGDLRCRCEVKISPRAGNAPCRKSRPKLVTLVRWNRPLSSLNRRARTTSWS